MASPKLFLPGDIGLPSGVAVLRGVVVSGSSSLMRFCCGETLDGRESGLLLLLLLPLLAAEADELVL